MKILSIGLREDLYIYQRLKEEAIKRGHEISRVKTSDLRIEVSSDNGYNFTLDNLEWPIEEVDIIAPYTISSRRKMDWFVFLRHLKEKYNMAILNDKYSRPDNPIYLTPTWDYIKQLDLGLPFPKSMVFYTYKQVDQVIEAFDFPFILKTAVPGMQSQGKGVFLINTRDELMHIVSKYESQAYRFTAREFIPNDGDIRIFTVGYKTVGAMYKTPAPGEYRNNVSQGGTATPYDWQQHPEVTAIAEKASKMLETEIAGVDIMINKETNKPYILEINSGPQFTGLETSTGLNIAGEIIKFFEQKVKSKK